MFATHQSGVDLSVWGLPAGNKVSGVSNGKPAAPNEADMSKLDPWKVVVPGLEDGASPLNPPGLSPKGRAASVPGLEQVAKAVAGQVVDDEDEDDEEESCTGTPCGGLGTAQRNELKASCRRCLESPAWYGKALTPKAQRHCEIRSQSRCRWQ
mmetsp:Transcript_75734/g.213324  ORF Transcript_75734/g.213324 Transcript_75734/m.213324 type:complete len:153 (+) Transcript_75734:68-526(+)